MASFDSVIDGWVSNVENILDEVLQDIVIDIGSSVIYLTPVKTGRLRGNWQLTIGSPSNQSRVRYDKNGSETLAEIKRLAASLESGDIAYIVNNLTYANQIELTSRRAPSGMVRATANEFLEIVRAAVSRRRFD